MVKYDIDVNTGTKVLEITKEYVIHVVVEKNGQELAIPTEAVILAIHQIINLRKN